jgi:hypothetical protein
MSTKQMQQVVVIQETIYRMIQVRGGAYPMLTMLRQGELVGLVIGPDPPPDVQVRSRMLKNLGMLLAVFGCDEAVYGFHAAISTVPVDAPDLDPNDDPAAQNAIVVFALPEGERIIRPVHVYDDGTVSLGPEDRVNGPLSGLMTLLYAGLLTGAVLSVAPREAQVEVMKRVQEDGGRILTMEELTGGTG